MNVRNFGRSHHKYDTGRFWDQGRGRIRTAFLGKHRPLKVSFENGSFLWEKEMLRLSWNGFFLKKITAFSSLSSFAKMVIDGFSGLSLSTSSNFKKSRLLYLPDSFKLILKHKWKVTDVGYSHFQMMHDQISRDNILIKWISPASFWRIKKERYWDTFKSRVFGVLLEGQIRKLHRCFFST